MEKRKREIWVALRWKGRAGQGRVEGEEEGALGKKRKERKVKSSRYYGGW